MENTEAGAGTPPSYWRLHTHVLQAPGSRTSPWPGPATSVWAQDQRGQLWGIHWRRKFLSPTPDLQTQRFWGGGQQANAFTNPQGLLSSGLEPLTKDSTALGDHGIHRVTQRAQGNSAGRGSSGHAEGPFPGTGHFWWESPPIRLNTSLSLFTFEW